MNRVKLAAVIAACVSVMGIGASAASAKTTTYHFFSKDVYVRISDSTGKPLPPSNTMPTIGDRFSIGSDDYVGNHSHHAKRATASDHIICVLTSTTGLALCDGQIAIGGSMIFADDWTLDFNSTAPTTIQITGGTGRFRHAHGTVFAKSVSQNTTDLVIKVTT
jgi:hypothetical protein